MKTLTKAAISAAAVMAITAGTLALTASAAVNASTIDLPQINYTANTVINQIYDTTLSLEKYSVTDRTRASSTAFFCVGSSGSKITTNAVKNGAESSLTAIDAYKTNYKWCSVRLRDTSGEARAITSLRYQNEPNEKSVRAVLSGDTLAELNGTFKEGFYVFSINESSSSSAGTLSQNDLTVTVPSL